MSKQYFDYDKDTQEFINIMGLHYINEVYEEEGLCTIIEDGKPKKWEWEYQY